MRTEKSRSRGHFCPLAFAVNASLKLYIKMASRARQSNLFLIAGSILFFSVRLLPGDLVNLGSIGDVF